MSKFMRPSALALALTGLLTTSGGAQPIDYPYCAMQGGRNAYENCGYSNLRQCLAAVSGVGGHCQPNPRYGSYRDRFYDDDPPPRRKRERRREY